MSEFNRDIVQWVSLDNRINDLRNEMRELRQSRNDLKDKIYTFAEQNELDRAVIKISDGQLKFQQTKQSSPITLKYLKRCLSECITDESQVDSSIGRLVKYMFVCAVKCGEYTLGSKLLRRPPKKPNGQNGLYDSVVDHVENPSIFVTFDNSQSLPLYLITFTFDESD